MIRYSLILMSVCLVSALVLSFTYKLAQPRIEAQMRDEETLALKEIFPEAEDFKEDSIDGISYYRVECAGGLIGYVISVSTKGYASEIDMRVGIDKQGKIKGIKILSQQETPGLGARMVEVKPGESKPWFLKQFEGRTAQELNLENIEAITSATITSSVVIDAVKKEVEEFLSKIK